MKLSVIRDGQRKTPQNEMRGREIPRRLAREPAEASRSQSDDGLREVELVSDNHDLAPARRKSLETPAALRTFF